MRKRLLSVLMVLAMAVSPCIGAGAMLTEEEQLYYKEKKAESEALEKVAEETEAAETAEEPETQSEAESESEPETEPAGEPAREAQTETADGENADAPLVALDPGHQSPDQDMSGEEPNGPGSETMRACMTPGTEGVTSGLAEYELNLTICLQLKEELIRRGYRVLLTHETNDVSLSDVERCRIANEAGADILIHVHGNTSEDAGATGALVTAPSSSNPYVSEHYNSSMKLADDLLTTYCEVTGFNRRGIYLNDNLTSINWAEMPVTVLELGYMSNPEDDAFMAGEENQETMVRGLADGIDKYFGR